MTIYNDTMSDGVLIDGTAGVVQQFSVDLQVYYAVNEEIESEISFYWSVGELPLYWWVIEGYVHPPDDTKSLDVSVPEKQNFIQTILARTPKEVGEYFARESRNWEIVYLKRYSQPADIYLNDPSLPNDLQVVDYKFPQFSVSTRSLIKMGMTVSVVQIYQRYQGSGGATFYGSADAAITSGAVTPTTSNFVYDSSGGHVLTGGSGGAVSSFATSFLTYGGIKTFLLSDVIFGLGSAPALIAPTNTVATACGSCISFPLELFIENNFSNPGVLGNFLQRNAYTFPSILPLIYSGRSNSWLAFKHFEGSSGDNANIENWRFQFEWACTNSPFGQENATSTPVFKFSIIVTRKNLGTNIAIDTRIVIIFSSDDVCETVRNFKEDFIFNLNTKTNYINNGNGIVPISVLLNDRIGIFKSSYWTDSPYLNLRISNANVLNQGENKDISSIIPKPPTLYQLGTSFARSSTAVI
jgi:hypothetical protein